MSEEEKQPEEKPAEPEKRVKIRDITEEGAAKASELRYTKRFHMTYSNEDGVIQEGEFTIKRPNLSEQARIGTLCAELRDDKPAHSIDRATHQLHDALATCSVIVVQAPPWFKPSEMFDSDPLFEVYEVALKFHQSFRKDRVGK